ncbi:OmpA family protein [Paramagnetospirillum kuznetsovii]|uniref:OmpA family protein n=1 Tax=Paramagnetospirillum kuznetsovii TaxID=2053833 RepID=A0A364P1A8_9PROT|nr:OmpA family protein [Paramagnetospirillum kuznetsovii]RAU23114.1 OmpA family protein [Paramagnetospirillum kuznetsovii]
MKSLRLATIIGMTALATACATPWDVAEVNEITAAPAPTVGSAFTKALFAEYKAYAIHEAKDEFEWDDAAIFARKGLRAATGEMVAPEEFANWDVPAARVKELTDARARLVGYFGNGARERVPAAAAKAQVMFDCWVEEEHEGDTTSDCRAAFLKVEPELMVKPAPVAAAPKIVKTFIVYFDFNKATLTKQAMKTLKEVAVASGEVKPTSIYVAGHTDTVGNNAYNDKLSAKRAKAVGDALAKMKVVTKLDQKSFGEAKLAVPTKDNMKEGKNRRVEISFEK